MRRISLAVAAALLASVTLPVGMAPGAAADSPTCPSPSAPASGSGSLVSPYEIATTGNLQWMRDRVNTGTNNEYYLQTANLDFGSCTWTTSIGSGLTTTTYFEGFYDGAGHLIDGLNIEGPGRAGLFGSVSLDPTVATSTSGVAIRDLGFSGDVVGVTGTGTISVGGLVGRLYTGTIEGSYATGTVNSAVNGARVGGLVGYISSTSQIRDSYATGAVTASTGTAFSNTAAGGLIGDAANVTVEDSYATGAVTTDPSSKGGLIGIDRGGVTVNDSYFNSDVVATSAGGTGKTTVELMDVSTFTAGGWSIASGYDATETWGICSAVNDGYPYLTAFYTSDPCSRTPAAAGGAVPDWPVFTFQTPGGGECVAISPQYPRLNTWFTLPDADAPCFIKGSVLTGWSIPGQDWAFAPGRRVWVVDSQTFTSVLEYEWVTIEYDSNIDAKDACVANGEDIPVADRTGITHIPRNVITDQPLWDAPVCSAPDYEFLGWTTDNPHGDPTILPKSGTMTAPAVNSDGDAANVIHLYAMWKYVG